MRLMLKYQLLERKEKGNDMDDLVFYEVAM